MKTYVHLWKYVSEFLLKWKIFQTKILEKIATHIFIFCNFFPLKSCRLWDNVEKYGRAGQTTDDNMAHACCMVGTKATDRHWRCIILVSSS